MKEKLSFWGFCLIVLLTHLVACFVLWYFIDNIIIAILPMVFFVIDTYQNYSSTNKKEITYTGPFIISKHNLSGNLVFFEMLADGTCGYYYKWYENCKGFRSDFYKLNTKVPEDIQAEIKYCGGYPQSQKAKAFDKILVNEYFEQKK